MTILNALLVLLVAVLVTTLTSLYDLTILLFTRNNIYLLLYIILRFDKLVITTFSEYTSQIVLVVVVAVITFNIKML